MIEWRDTAMILAARPHGETSVILDVFTPEHGRHAGIVRGGTSRKMTPHLQPGGQVEVVWKARLDDHIGSFTVEPQRSRAAMVLTNRLALAGLNAVCALLALALPERDPQPSVYTRSTALLDLLGRDDIWPLAYLQWEFALLDASGFALDLSCCAITGTTENLIYVSPKSGRAVSGAAAGKWASRLLPLPPVLAGQGDASNADIVQALGTTGWFIENRLLASVGRRSMPAARDRLLDELGRQSPNGRHENS